MQPTSSKSPVQTKEWTPPRLDKIGTLVDVAGSGAAGTQVGGGGVKT